MTMNESSPVNRKITILYGSQTGNAQEIAERVWRDSKRFHFGGPVKAMDDYEIAKLIYEPLVVFVCSTTGQGEEPDNMKLFWKFLLRKNLPSNSLKSLRFAVLGLGDSSYSNFNFAAKKLNKRLINLGAKPVVQIGLADDQHDLGADAVVDPWIKGLWDELLTIYPLPHGLSVLDEFAVCAPRWLVSIVEENVTGDEIGSFNNTRHRGTAILSNNINATVIENKRITSHDHFQDVRLIKFSTPGLNYDPGDVVMLTPHNSTQHVESFFNTVLSLKPDTVISVKEVTPDAPVPNALKKPMTLRSCAEEYWDLNITPRRYFFQLLSLLSPSPHEKEKLQEFASTEGQEELYNYCNRPRRTTLEVLQDFPETSANITLEHLFELFTPIKPRAFSIASSAKAHEGELHILLAVVKYQTKLFTPRLGLCSNWLAGLQLNHVLPIWIKKGSFHFPSDKKSPLIMIGPGTGVAPFRSIISEMAYLGNAKSSLLYLFFGCRYSAKDFHCRDEWKTLCDNGKLTLYCAFSRDQENKRYVQHLMKEVAHSLWTLVHDLGAYIYVAGNSKDMPKAVYDTFIQIFNDVGNYSLEESEKFMKTLETQRRYQTETWA